MGGLSAHRPPRPPFTLGLSGLRGGTRTAPCRKWGITANLPREVAELVQSLKTIVTFRRDPSSPEARDPEVMSPATPTVVSPRALRPETGQDETGRQRTSTTGGGCRCNPIARSSRPAG